MARVVVHIGTHKTGSTAFQNWAEANRSSLFEMTGLRYYKGYFANTHVEFTLLCLRTNRNMQTRARRHDWPLESFQAEVRSHIANELSGEDDVLVSDEALSYFRHPDEVERLTSLLGPRTIEYVVVLRDRYDFLRSYREQLKAANFPPSPYPDSFAYVEEDTWLTDYDALLTTFGHPAVVPYEQAMREHGSIIPALMAQVSPSVEIPSWRGTFANITASRFGLRRPPLRRYARRALLAAASRL